MSQTIVGLDLGTYSIKLVEISRDFRNMALVRCEEARIPLDPKVSREEAQMVVLQEQFAVGDLRQKTVICGYPTQMVSLRILTLPPTDQKNLEKIIPYEVENQIIMDLDDVHVDWDQLSPSETGEMRILAATVFKEKFRNFLQGLESLDLEPRDVTPDALALSYLVDPAEEACIALIDCGHSKTNVCIVHKGQPLLARSIAIAGREITRALEEDFKLAFLEAETLKQTDGMLAVRQGPGLTADQERLSKSIRRVVDELAAEIRQMQVQCEQTFSMQISEFHLFGGSAKLKNLAVYLSGVLNLPVKRQDYFAMYQFQDYREDQAISLQPALALALRGVKGKSSQRINFRKGEFRPQHSLQSAQVLLGKALTITLVILAFLLVNFVGRWLLLSTKIVKIEKEIQKEVARVVPNYQYKGTKHAVSVLQQQASGNLPESGPFAKIAQGENPLISLQRLSSEVPAEIPITVSDLSIDLNTIRLEGSAASREYVEKVREKLSHSPYFSKVSEDKISKNGDQYLFNLTLTLKNKGEEP